MKYFSERSHILKRVKRNIFDFGSEEDKNEIAAAFLADFALTSLSSFLAKGTSES